MTLKKLSVVSSAFLALASMANAALVNIATNTLAGPSRSVVTSTLASLPTGSAVRVGVWQGGVVPTITPQTRVSDLTGFIPLGESAADAADGTNGPFGTTAATANGSGWAFTINSVDNTDARFLSGTRLYIMVLNTQPGSLDGATQLTLLSDPGWTIPASGARTMTTAQVDSQAEVMYGVWGASQLVMGPINTTVPEPTAASISLLAGLGMLARRRR